MAKNPTDRNLIDQRKKVFDDKKRWQRQRGKVKSSIAKSNDERFVTIWKGHDAVTGEMIEDILRSQNMSPRLLGTRSPALIGVSQSIITVRIEVPVSCEIAASLLVQALLSKNSQDPQFNLGDEKADAKKRKIVAAGFALFFPGLGQVYGRQMLSGILLMAMWLALSFISIVNGALLSVFITRSVATVIDIYFGLGSVDKYNLGEQVSKKHQFKSAILQAMILFLLSLASSKY